MLYFSKNKLPIDWFKITAQFNNYGAGSEQNRHYLKSTNFWEKKKHFKNYIIE